MRKLIILVSIVVLTGCATRAGTKQAVDAVVIGQSIDRAISLYGVPDREATIEGKRYYIWERGGEVPIPGATTTSGTVAGKPVSLTTYGNSGATMTLHCQLALQVTDGIVVSATLDGNDCTAFRR